ncbi:SHOCT domain-containing protein [Caldisericum exile]|uniref:SHOCT domain-containing protein n=1 Tax=Caldisericum exile (strain DSM 21853 / NBRC 104410 / AZM16c01) TaxID=511051 RepID=A0A7U6GDD8_CALEA|nr:SHOCT domain-containing protein [Caldisericum exile]BAL80319.1 hypothetical protein CSE_01930 [Caldisericum exile AZM16c01]
MMHWFLFRAPFFGACGFFPGFGMFLMLLFWVLIVILIAFGVKEILHGFGHRDSHLYSHQHEDEALKILKQLYAEGKLTDEEFEKKKRHLLD